MVVTNVGKTSVLLSMVVTNVGKTSVFWQLVVTISGKSSVSGRWLQPFWRNHLFLCNRLQPFLIIQSLLSFVLIQTTCESHNLGLCRKKAPIFLKYPLSGYLNLC